MIRVFIMGMIFLGLFGGCQNGHADLEQFMVDIAEFKISNDVLKDGDYVEVLGGSGNLTMEHEIDFYNLIVVRSEVTGDTVNVLVTNFFKADLNNTRTRFLSNTSTIGKLVENAGDLTNDDLKNLKDIKSKSYRKVFYDSEYIQVDVRRYPTTTGNLSDFTITGDLDVDLSDL